MSRGFYAQTLGNHIYCRFIFIFFVLFLKSCFLHMVISDTNNLQTALFDLLIGLKQSEPRSNQEFIESVVMIF